MRFTFCSNTLVLTPPASGSSCLAVMTMLFPSTFTSRSSGLKIIHSLFVVIVCVLSKVDGKL